MRISGKLQKKTTVECFSCCQGGKSYACGMVWCLFSLMSQQIKRGQRVHYKSTRLNVLLPLLLLLGSFAALSLFNAPSSAPQSEQEMDNGGGINSVITFDWLFSLLSERIGNIRLTWTTLFGSLWILLILFTPCTSFFLTHLEKMSIQ